MSNLYELKGQYLMLQNALANDSGETTDIEKVMEEIEDNIDIKAENYAKIIKNFDSSADSIKGEIDRLSARKKMYEMKSKELKERLLNTMIDCKKEKIKTPLFTMFTRNNKAPLIVDVETDKLPDEFVVIKESPDTTKLRKYVEETGDVTYAHIGDSTKSLTIK